MSRQDCLPLRIKSYKCFGEEGAGFEDLRPLNLVIGRNNSGKSSLLDLIEYIVEPSDIRPLGHKGNAPEVLITTRATEEQLQRVFSPHTSGGDIPGNHWEYGKAWVSKPITWALERDKKHRFVSSDPPAPKKKPAIMEFLQSLAAGMENPFKEKVFKRLRSDRDISPEEDSYNTLVTPNGEGVTTLIRHFLTKAALSSSVVEDTMLDELNQVFEPDASFSNIIVRQYNNSFWETYLTESSKGRIPLSQSGSGLKTILLVLTFLHLIPVIENRPLDSYLFGFEELENNLHPALQRRLFTYLRDIAREKGCMMFITTHSNVVIDLFGRDETAQIIHVQHDGEKAAVSKALAYIQRKGILDDLDVRASDLLQSNGIVWVEGAHYQCLFYGGRLLAHLSAEDPEDELENLISILRVNRNAMILIDSDRDKEGADLNSTKKRLISEIDGMDGLAWVTAGREVENYIPLAVLASHYNQDIPNQFDQYCSFAASLDQIKSGERNRFLADKVGFARRVAPLLTKEFLAESLDLSEKLDLACKHIDQWNGLRPPERSPST